jgi:hypothetical protein
LRRQSLDENNNVSFVTKLSQGADKVMETDTAPLPQEPIASVVPPSALAITHTSLLLPPIELQPPSPPRTLTRGTNPDTKPSNILTTFDSNSISGLSPSGSSSSVFFTPSSSPQRHPVGPAWPDSKTSELHVPLSTHNYIDPRSLQQPASLGRATAAGPALSNATQGGRNENSGHSGGSSHPRRNSLGDLKIPARISQAQVGLRRDLGMVREFANNIERW